MTADDCIRLTGVSAAGRCKQNRPVFRFLSQRLSDGGGFRWVNKKLRKNFRKESDRIKSEKRKKRRAAGGIFKMEDFILKGDIGWSVSKDEMKTVSGGYLVCVGSISQGVFEKIPEEYRDLPVRDLTGKLIVPGLTDLHIHAPQYGFRGTSMDLELLEWLEQQTFPAEAAYEDVEYAKKAYSIFAERMRTSATTRACIFATRHGESTKILMDLMEETGLISFVGKVNMDRNAPDELRERNAVSSAADTVAWLENVRGKYRRTFPILTPRFIPSCTDELMESLAGIRRRYDLPVQSHLSENQDEVKWVRELCPEADFYGDAYQRFGLFGGEAKTVMAHCVYSCQEEAELIKKNGVFVAHCPASNMNLASGIAPVRRYLDAGMNIGLGSDAAGGQTESIFRAMSDAVQVSKLYCRLIDPESRPLTFEEAFYLGTAGGGAFFGKAGSFEKGFELDAVVLDDSALLSPQPLSVRARIERAAYLSADLTSLWEKYVRGRRVYERTLES